MYAPTEYVNAMRYLTHNHTCIQSIIMSTVTIGEKSEKHRHGQYDHLVALGMARASNSGGGGSSTRSAMAVENSQIVELGVV